MIYVVTGATSFIGSETVRLLAENGNKVYAVCRQGSTAIAFLPDSNNINIVYSEMSEYSCLDRKIPHADVFINFAWDGTKSIQDRDYGKVHERNVRYTQDALESSYRMGCKLFVETGSQAEYGICNDLITENTPCRPFTEYGKTKLITKEQGFVYAKNHDIKYMHLRIFSIYGARDKERTLVKTCIRKMLANECVELSLCTQMWNFLHVCDAAKQIQLLCEYAVTANDLKHEVYNIASRDTRRLKDFIIDIKRITKSKSKLIYGAIKPEYIVSLNPDTTKTYNAIQFVSEVDFETGIKEIIQNS